MEKQSLKTNLAAKTAPANTLERKRGADQIKAAQDKEIIFNLKISFVVASLKAVNRRNGLFRTPKRHPY